MSVSKCGENKTEKSNKLHFEISFDENMLKKFSLDSKTSIQSFLSQNMLKNLNQNCKLILNEEFRDKIENAVKNVVIEYLKDNNNELISSSDKYMLEESDVCNKRMEKKKMKSSFTCNEIQLKYKDTSNSDINISSKLKKKNSSGKLRFRQSSIKNKINDWEVINELSNDIECFKGSLSTDNILIDVNNRNKFQEYSLSDKINMRKMFNIEDSQLIGDVKGIHNANSLLNVKKNQKVEFLRENASCETSKLKNALEKSQKDVINDILQPENICFGLSKSNSFEKPKEQLKFSNEQLMSQRISSIPNALKLTTIQNCEKYINADNKSVNPSNMTCKSKSSEINKNTNYKLPLVSRIPSLKVPRYIAITDYIFEPFEISTPCDIHDIYPEEKANIYIEPYCDLNKTITCITSSSFINKELTKSENSGNFTKEKQKIKAFKIISVPPKFSKYEQIVEETVEECHFCGDKLSMIINRLTNKHYSLTVERINIEYPLIFSCKNVNSPLLVNQINKKMKNIPHDSFIPQIKVNNKEYHADLRSADERKLLKYPKEQVDLSILEKKCSSCRFLYNSIMIDNDFKNKKRSFPYQNINESDKKKVNESFLKCMNQLYQNKKKKNYQQENEKRVRTETCEKSQKEIIDELRKKYIYEKRNWPKINSNMNEIKQKCENSKNASNRTCFYQFRPFPIDSWPLYATSRDENRNLSAENKIYYQKEKCIKKNEYQK